MNDGHCASILNIRLLLYFKFTIVLVLMLDVRYCECFASNVYCDGCNCANCHNVENDPARKHAIEALLDRNPNAFKPKIDSSPQAVRDKRVCIKIHCGCCTAHLGHMNKCLFTYISTFLHLFFTVYLLYL